MEQQPDRQEEVLEEALALVAERGVRGASLRELARRLELSQPSLYHYFKSKDELIALLAERGAAHMVDTMMVEDMLRLEPSQLTHHVKDRVLQLYRTERHRRYVRFLFVVAIEAPEHQALLKRVFEERLIGRASSELASLFQQAPEALQLIIATCQMVSRAIGLALMEDLIIFGQNEPSEHTLQFADFVAQSAAPLLAQLPSLGPRSDEC